MLMKGRLDRNLDESQRRLSDQQIGWIDNLVADDRIRLVFNDTFFTAADSREPESAGVLGATVGSAMALFVTVSAGFATGCYGGCLFGIFCPARPRDRFYRSEYQ
jgi:phosphate transport system permease protein